MTKKINIAPEDRLPEYNPSEKKYNRQDMANNLLFGAVIGAVLVGVFLLVANYIAATAEHEMKKASFYNHCVAEAGVVVQTWDPFSGDRIECYNRNGLISLKGFE